MGTSWALGGLNRCSTARNTNLNNGHLPDCSTDDWQDKMITRRCTAKSAKLSSFTVPLMIILWPVLIYPNLTETRPH